MDSSIHPSILMYLCISLSLFVCVCVCACVRVCVEELLEIQLTPAHCQIAKPTRIPTSLPPYLLINGEGSVVLIKTQQQRSSLKVCSCRVLRRRQAPPS